MAEAGIAASDRPVFLLSTARSGSGVLQRALNCHSRLVVWGEHFGFLATAAAAIVQMQNPAQKHYPLHPGDNRGPGHVLPTLRDPSAALEWVNPLSMEEYVGALRRFVTGYFASQIGSAQRWGFREVRYNTPAVLRGLKLLYPQARFVFLLRDIPAVAEGRVQAAMEAGTWESLGEVQRRERVHGFLREATGQFRVLREFATAEPEVATVVRFEQLVSRPRQELGYLLDRLGLSETDYDLDAALGAVARGYMQPVSESLRALIAAQHLEEGE